MRLPSDLSSCKILEQLSILLVPLKVLGLDEVLDPLLNHLDIWPEHALQLLDNFQHKLLVKHCLQKERQHRGEV